MRLAGDRGFQIGLRRTDRQAGGGVADGFQILQVPVRMTGFTFCSRAKYRRDVVVTLNVGLRREIQITTIRLRFPCKRVTQILFGFRAFQLHTSLLKSLTTMPRDVSKRRDS